MKELFSINCETIDESNLFIRALLYEFSNYFDRFIWSYLYENIPASNSVMLGYADINYSDTPVNIGITYKQKGIINDLVFSSSNELPTDTLDGIQQCVENAKQSKLHAFCFSSQLLNIQLNNYIGDKFNIYSLNKKSFLTFEIYGLNEKDAKTQFFIRAKQIIDVISLAVNKPTGISEPESTSYTTDKATEPIKYCKSDDHFKMGISEDDHSKYLLQQNIIKYIDEIINNKSFSILDNACRVFHSALKLNQEFLNNKELNADYNEIAAITFMSALETVATYPREKKKCNVCGQDVYKIKDRVSAFILSFYNKDVKKQIDCYYRLRSSFIHEGKQFAKIEYNSDLKIPYFDAESKSYLSIDNEWSNGFKMIVGFALRNYFLTGDYKN